MSIETMTSTPPQDATTELFSAGNYADVAMADDSDQWQTYAAMGLIGRTQAAIDGLNRFDLPDSQFYLAVTHWINGDEATAVRILEEISEREFRSAQHSRNLLELIRKPQIHVLAQLPWTRKPPHDLLTAAAQDGKFKVQNISFHPQDLANEPDADIRKFCDFSNPPDFYICQMVEWHLIPPNIQELPCPIIAQTADYDLHIQAVYPWLHAFDELLVTDQTEWRDVCNLVALPVSTFPKSFGIADTLPPLSPERRDIDVFLSGSVTHPYHPDKVRLLHQLLRMPDSIKTLAIHGFVEPHIYHAMLRQSKVCVTYVRHPGATPTRGLEALSMGCAVVTQKGSALTQYVGEEEGVLTYTLEEDDLVPTIHRIVNEWTEFENRARRGMEIIRREFALSRVASQYLRFLTFLAARPRNRQSDAEALAHSDRIQLKDPLVQKRTILCKGWLPGGVDVLQKMRACNIAKLQAKAASSHVVIDIARELVLEYAMAHLQASHNGKETLVDQDCLRQAIQHYRAGLVQFPESLVLRFNLIRTALHFGQPQDVAEALKLADETCNAPASSWQIDVMEDVFPWDFFSRLFNYRKYFDLVTQHLTTGTSVKPALTQLILASLYHYRNHYSDNREDVKQATILDPDFPFYKLRYAQQLVKQGVPEDDEEAGRILIELAEDTILFDESIELLKQLQNEGRFANPQLTELIHLGMKYRKNSDTVKSLGIPIYDADWRLAILQPAPPRPSEE
ncbi:glycosyltransferase, partial [Candidatus Poribacteria bacterium]|nr:glycosyltransferase [Candidatus Poribacteria bacterium]